MGIDNDRYFTIRSYGEPELSVVIPAYNEERNIRMVYDQVANVLSGFTEEWEIIFSDDGSKDSTWTEIMALNQHDARVKGVRLSRNFGHQHALLAGLAQAKGRAVVSMDADLQHPPEVIPRLVDEWRKGSKVVHTVRKDAQHTSILKRFTSKAYYRLYSYLSGFEVRNGMADFRLLDRDVLRNILRIRDSGIYIRGVVHWLGFSDAIVEYMPNCRFSGTSKFTLSKMARLAFDGITSFSIVPLRLSIAIGLVTGLLSFSFLVYAIWAKFYADFVVPGWASAVSMLSLLFGILFMILGIIGEYVGRILIEVRGRPHFIVCDEVGIDNIAEDVGDLSVYSSRCNNMSKRTPCGGACDERL